MTFLKAQPLHAPPCLDSFDGDCLREGRSELRPTLTLEPCTYAGTLVVGRITSAVGRSVGHIGRAAGGVPAPASITAHQPPVDPAGHDTERDGCGCSPEGFPNIGALHSRLYWCQSITLSSLIGLPPFYGYPSRGLKYVLCAVVTESYHPHNTGGNRSSCGNLLERYGVKPLNLNGIEVAASRDGAVTG